MGNTFYFAWEVELIEWIQSFMGDFGTLFCKYISMFGETGLTVALFTVIYYWLDKDLGKKIGFNLIFVQVMYPMVKNITLRRRPYMDHEGIQCLKLVDSNADAMDIKAQGYSFPSGHSATAAVVYGSLAYFLRKNWAVILSIVLPLLVGISRFSLGVHYPTDVIAGWLLGIISVFGMPLLAKVLPNRVLRYGILLLLALPGWFYCKTNDFYSGYGMLLGFVVTDLFERRYVQFKNTRNPVRGILRVVTGVGLFLGLNELMKLPFSEEFLETAGFWPFFVRAIRYAIGIFLSMGVFPLSFRIWDKKEGVAKTSEKE